MALVVATAPEALTVVGGLPLVVRTVLALTAAGIHDVRVFGGSQQTRVARALAGRAPGVRYLASAAEVERAGLPECVHVLPGTVLVDTEAVARVRPVPRSAVAAMLHDGGSGPVPSAGLYVPLDPDHPPAALERILLDHLGRSTSAGDSYLARLIDRRLSRPITRALLRWPVTPSQITLASLVVGLAGAAGLATLSYAARLAGVCSLVLSIVLDCVDGEVARARFEQSAAGARLDVIADYAVHVAVFLGLGVGLARQALQPLTVWAAVTLLGGVVAAMATVHTLFIRPALARGGDLHWTGDGASLRGTPLANVVEKLASRDYTYLLLLLALLGHLEWFVFAAAVGSWVFVAVLAGYWAYVRVAPRRPVILR